MYFKTVNMTKWKFIEDHEITLDELCEELFVFVVFMDPSQTESFERHYMKNHITINEINVGDRIKYENPASKIKK